MNDKELRKLAEGATPGPWNVNTAYIGWEAALSEDLPEKDAAFIAAANPATVLRLLERIAALRATLTIYSDNRIYSPREGGATVDYVPAVESLAADDAKGKP